MNTVTQVMDHETCLWQHKSGCIHPVFAHQWIRASKANRSGAQIRVVQLVF